MEERGRRRAARAAHDHNTAAALKKPPPTTKYTTKPQQSVPLYRAFRALKDDAQAWQQFTPAQRRVVELELRDFVLGGVALEGADKEEYNSIQQELAKLSTKFSNNVLDATKAFKKLVTDKAVVDGLPPTALGLAAQQARQEGHADATPENGPWLLTLDFPCYYPVMTHAKDRALREEMYRAYVTRASKGDSDNTGNIERVLALRKRKAELLGFKSYADLSMASKMATLEEAEKLLEELRAASWDAATRDLDEVKSFAAEKQGGAAAAPTDDLLWWDVAYWAERLREDRYDLQDEQLRPYFALPAVLDGLFKLVNRLFGVDVVPADGEAPVWHPDVRFFRVVDATTREPRAAFYLDPYSRPAEKRGGAWMAEVVVRSALLADPSTPDKPRLPVAHMVCNQSPPVDGAPSLMTFREVETLFHEFGHAAQHMLTQVDQGMVAGIRGIEWDAVELPSQWLEGFCYHKATLLSFARHWQTGEPLPDALYERLVAAKNFRSGTMMLRQIHFASVDLELHARYEPAVDAKGEPKTTSGGKTESVFDRDRTVASRTQVMAPFPEDRFLCSFSHIFAGGYSAGYYSYKWAETMSADAFAAFEEAGLDDEKAVKETGARFRDTVLGLGGSVPPADVFKMFRGRGPSTEALLKQSGLLVKA